jgi:hypothetical protein
MGSHIRGSSRALITHGTNLGMAARGHSAEGTTTDMMHHVGRFFLTDGTLKAINDVVVNFDHRLGFSGLWASFLLASLYPRY